MRPASVFAKDPGSEIEQLRGDLHGWWRQATRVVMVLLSLHGLTPAQIAALLDCHPATERRWISRFNSEGLAGLAAMRPAPAGGSRLTSRISALLGRPGAWTLPRIHRYLRMLAAGQHAQAVPAGPAGGDLAAAQADRPR